MHRLGKAAGSKGSREFKSLRLRHRFKDENILLNTMNIELLKNPYIAGSIVILCIIFFKLGNTGRVFGSFINKFLPCQQNPANSFPCFGQYDIAVMVTATIVGSIFFLVLIFDVYKLFRS